MKCQCCGKTPMFGHNVSHSKRHTAKISRPNIHPVSVNVGGRKVRATMCTRCLRTYNKIVQEG